MLALEAGASLLERSKACSVGLRVGSNPTTNNECIGVSHPREWVEAIEWDCESLKAPIYADVVEWYTQKI